MSLNPKLGDTGRLILVASALAIVVMGLIIGSIVLLPPQYIDNFQWKWMRFSLGFMFLIWFSLKTYWKLRRSLAFWGIFTCFFLVHGFGVGHFYYAGQGLSILEVGVIGGAEWGCMALVIYWVLHTAPDLRTRPRRSRWTPTL
jgi:hypothetical protein